MKRQVASLAQKATPALQTLTLPMRLTAHGVMLCLAFSLVACGGGSVDPAAPVAVAPSGNGTSVTPPLAADTIAAAIAQASPTLSIQPSFHMAPVQPAEPGSEDEGGSNASARWAPARSQALAADVAGLSTARLTPQALQAHWAGLRNRAQAMSSTARPLTSSITNYITFTPAQIRAAYLLPPLPAAGATLSASDAAALGAGQTIYVLDAYHLPNALVGLNAFSTRFGLPSCTAVTLSATTALPLGKPSASNTSCDFAVAYADVSGKLSNTVPATNAGWNSESALDIQWAHAMAPLARIVLIEAADAANALVYSVPLANRMGPGVVSMSWGSVEDASNTSLESLFTGTGMSYFAAAGDAGTQMNWPAASPSVVAVGGTSLGFDGTARYEAAWSQSGGGVSKVFGLPGYQAGYRMAGASFSKRAVSDVAMNADPNTGQYVAMLGANNAVSWYTLGGTSMSTPMWAGLSAVANAKRQAAGKQPLGDMHGLLYTTIANVPGKYASAFNDVSAGSNGGAGCAMCTSGTGYDQATGLGTPNATALWGLMLGSVTPPLPSAQLPDVATGAAFQVQWASTDPSDGSKLSYSASGMPAGLTVSSTGLVSGAIAAAGTYSFSVTVQSAGGGQASGNVSIKVSAVNHAPTLAGGSIVFYTGSGAQQATLAGSDPDGDSLSYSMTGGPAGLALSASGALSWASPVKGSYVLTVTAKDPGGLKASASYSLTVKAVNVAPKVTATTINAKVGTAISAPITATDANADTLSFSLSGAPAGMTIGPKGGLAWPAPVAGSYTPVVTATDPGGLSGSATITVNVVQPNRAPTLKAAALPGGYTGQAYSAQVVATDLDLGDTLTYSATGTPAGLTVSRTGGINWPKPVTGSYTFAITVKDAKAASATANFTLKVVVPPTAPKIAMAAVNGKVGTPIAVASTFSDANGDPLTFSVQGGPDGMFMGPKGGLNWPTPMAGVYAVTLVATDPGGLSGTANVTVTVIQPNRAPSMAAANLSGSVGVAFSAQLQATDPDGNKLTYTLAGGPAGLSLSGTGLLSWAKPVKGSYAFTVTAKDPSGATGAGTVKLVIS